MWKVGLIRLYRQLSRAGAFQHCARHPGMMPQRFGIIDL